MKNKISIYFSAETKLKAILPSQRLSLWLGIASAGHGFPHATLCSKQCLVHLRCLLVVAMELQLEHVVVFLSTALQLGEAPSKRLLLVFSIHLSLLQLLGLRPSHPSKNMISTSAFKTLLELMRVSQQVMVVVDLQSLLLTASLLILQPGSWRSCKADQPRLLFLFLPRKKILCLF